MTSLIVFTLFMSSAFSKVYLLYGSTQSGKSSFIFDICQININIGDGQHSETKLPQIYTCKASNKLVPNEVIQIIDVPGHDDTRLTENSIIMETIQNYLLFNVTSSFIDGILIFNSLSSQLTANRSILLLTQMFGMTTFGSSVLIIGNKHNRIVQYKTLLQSAKKALIDFCQEFNINDWMFFNTTFSELKEILPTSLSELQMKIKKLIPLKVEIIEERIYQLEHLTKEICKRETKVQEIIETFVDIEYDKLDIKQVKKNIHKQYQYCYNGLCWNKDDYSTKAQDTTYKVDVKQKQSLKKKYIEIEPPKEYCLEKAKAYLQLSAQMKLFYDIKESCSTFFSPIYAYMTDILQKILEELKSIREVTNILQNILMEIKSLRKVTDIFWIITDKLCLSKTFQNYYVILFKEYFGYLLFFLIFGPQNGIFVLGFWILLPWVSLYQFSKFTYFLTQRFSVFLIMSFILVLLATFQSQKIWSYLTIPYLLCHFRTFKGALKISYLIFVYSFMINFLDLLPLFRIIISLFYYCAVQVAFLEDDDTKLEHRLNFDTDYSSSFLDENIENTSRFCFWSIKITAFLLNRILFVSAIYYFVFY